MKLSKATKTALKRARTLLITALVVTTLFGIALGAGVALIFS